MLRGLITVVIIIGIAFTFLSAQLEPSIQWKKALPTNARGFYVQQTNDKGYVVTGQILESGSEVYTDFYLLKIDSLSNTLWEKTFGYSQNTDHAHSVLQTMDEGYIIAGMGGDSSKSYLVKTDRLGNFEWDILKFRSSIASIVQQTVDKGYITAGLIESSEQGLIYIMKIDSLGNFKWYKVLPDSNYIWTGFIQIQQTSDGGYIIGSEALTKTDSLGNIQWRKGYDKIFVIFSVLQTTDGGYITTGIGANEANPNQWSKIFLLKTDSSGNQVWKKKLSDGSGHDQGSSVKQTQDGGYFICGDLDGDAFVIKTDSLGNAQWKKLLGEANKWAWCGQQTSDGGYIIIVDEQLVKLAPLY
jgi:hypothetical protein